MCDPDDSVLVIHRYWEGEPFPLTGYITSVLRNLNPEPVRDWTPETLPSRVIPYLAGIDDQVGESDQMRHRANVIRLALLYEYGGWWYDHDVFPLTPVRMLPFPVVACHGARMCNSFMGFPAGHPELKLALDRIAVNPPGSLSSPVASGEILLNEIVTVPKISYPFDAAGRRIPFTPNPFAVHFYGTSRKRSQGHTGANPDIQISSSKPSVI